MNFDRELLSSALPAYDIGDELGQGGMGVVVSGQHRQLGRRVAIKQLPEAFAADPGVRRRFTAEAQVLASLDHPHVVPVYDFVEREGICLLVMELLPGGTLRSRAAADGCTAPYAVAVSLACLSGLSAAHRRGILHRDVKPENMLFAASGVLKVTDFGIAKVIGGPGTVLTRVGDVVGTPAYIAPEQVRGGKLTPATDVYALATMLYELLAGVFPFTTETEGEDLALLFKHAYEKPVPLRDVAPGVPDPVAAVVMRGLATEPADRFETADAFGVALAEAATQAWGPGWLAAEQVPIMDAGPMIGAAGHPSGARPAAAAAGPTLSPAGPGLSAAGPTLSPAGLGLSAAGPTLSSAAPATESGRRADALSQAPTQGGEGIAAAPGTETAIPARSPEARRRVIIAAVVVAVILVVILAVFLLPKMFTTYKSSARLAPPPATAQLR
jgi:serine/threonine-protein kinase